MPDEGRRTIIDRANRMLRQSKTLRKLSEDLLQESRDIRKGAKKLVAKGKGNGKKRPKN
jgi:hypothetical protein